MTMRRRALKLGKWTALTLFVLSLAAWAVSATTLGGGAFDWGYIGFARGALEMGFRGEAGGWGNPRFDFEVSPTFNPGSLQPFFTGGYPPNATLIAISLWLPTLLAFVATATLFVIDRRRIPSGHCKCGYSLTGNTSGRCPECGLKVGAA